MHRTPPFLEPLLKKRINPSQTSINIVSSYWSDNVVQTINLMQEAGFKIASLSIPDALKEYDKDDVNIFINQKTVPEIYLKLENINRGSTRVIDAQTGKIGFEHNCKYLHCLK